MANQWPLIGETLFSSVPPSNSLVSVSDPRRAFWADTAPFSGPRLASCVASGTTEIQGHRQVCRARRGGPRTPSTTTDANLDCAFVENALFYTDPWLWKANRRELSYWPDLVLTLPCLSKWFQWYSTIYMSKPELKFKSEKPWNSDISWRVLYVGIVFSTQ